MLLAVDVGNTHTVLGLFNVKTGEILNQFRITTNKKITADELGMLVSQLFYYNKIEMQGLEAVIISSVVPQIMYAMQHMCLKYFNKKPIVIGPGVKTGMNIKCDNPREVGADRIVNGVAAFKKYGGPIIIVDFGTATTLCVVNEKCEYLGGAIMPGVKISADALTHNTAKLNRVELEKPEHAICKNTIESIQAGLIYGNVGAVDYVVKKMIRELDTNKDIPVIATGGLATMMGEESDMITCVNRSLTLEGLYYIYGMNKIN